MSLLSATLYDERPLRYDIDDIEMKALSLALRHSRRQHVSRLPRRPIHPCQLPHIQGAC